MKEKIRSSDNGAIPHLARTTGYSFVPALLPGIRLQVNGRRVQDGRFAQRFYTVYHRSACIVMSIMPDEEITGFATAIAGGLGLGLLVGSEYHGTSATLLGAACVLIAIACLTRSHIRKRRNE